MRAGLCGLGCAGCVGWAVRVVRAERAVRAGLCGLCGLGCAGWAVRAVRTPLPMRTQPARIMVRAWGRGGGLQAAHCSAFKDGFTVIAR